MKKLSVLILFSATGLPAWRWALPHKWWNSIDAVLPPDLHAYVSQRALTWCEDYIRLFAVAWFLFFVIDLILTQTIGMMRLGKDRRGFEAIDHHVPHVRFRPMANGFQVTMRNSDGMPGGVMLFVLTAITAGIWYHIAGLTTWLVLTIILGVALGYFVAARQPTRVQVTPNVIFIKAHREGRKKLDRDHFVSFTPNRGWLGYTYGLRNTAFGGVVGNGIVVEIAAALNQLLESAPRVRNTFRYTAPPTKHTPMRRRSEF